MVSAMNIIGSDKSLQDHWVKRFIAYLIDYIIFLAISSVIFFFLNPFDYGAVYIWTAFMPGLAGLFMFVYAMILEAAGGGATIGKRVMNLRVIALTGEVDIGKAAIRNISKIYWLFLLLDWLIGFVSDGDPKQKWLDRVGGTTVIITTALNEAQQHTYQSQQSMYAPPPQEQYQTRHEQVYQYPPQPSATAPQPQKGQPASQEFGPTCASCGGKMTETGAGRLKCIRCGKIQ